MPNFFLKRGPAASGINAAARFLLAQFRPWRNRRVEQERKVSRAHRSRDHDEQIELCRNGNERD
jgi:hypothetical protein